MDYQKIYNNIIERGKTRILEGYTESHHIIPKCMGGLDNSDNLVELTPEEHYICHLLLVRLHPDNIRLVKAAMFMLSANSFQHRTNKGYGWLKKQYSTYMKGPNNPTKLNGPWNKGISGYKKKDNGITDTGRKILQDNMLGNKNPCHKIKPWNHPRTTEITRILWKRAAECYDIWISNNKPAYCALFGLVMNKKYNWKEDGKEVSPFMNMVKYFKNGWVPIEDDDWNKFKGK